MKALNVRSLIDAIAIEDLKTKGILFILILFYIAIWLFYFCSLIQSDIDFLLTVNGLVHTIYCTDIL